MFPADELLLLGAALAIRSIRVTDVGIRGPLCKRHAGELVALLVEAGDEGEHDLPEPVRKLVATLRAGMRSAATTNDGGADAAAPAQRSYT